jgi:hypothetical protein
MLSHLVRDDHIEQLILFMFDVSKWQRQYLYKFGACSGVARGAVLGNDCSLSTLPNMEKACIDPTLCCVKLRGRRGCPGFEIPDSCDESLRPEVAPLINSSLPSHSRNSVDSRLKKMLSHSLQSLLRKHVKLVAARWYLSV